MSFIETVRRARDLLQQEGRITIRGLKREFGLDDEALEELVDELVEGQQVAAREGKVLSWIGAATAEADRPEREARAIREAAPEAERRQLTVLFCDVVDSTELASRLDAEDLRAVLGRYQEAVIEATEPFAGHVAQYLGDGLLVYFGWPQAHEDDAERALRAGLEILQRLGAANRELAAKHGLELQVRVGIHTGPVVVGEIGVGERRETLALGETANIAARVQGEAAPGSVVMTRETLHLVPGIFVTEALGPRKLKGVSKPVPLYRALQASGVQSRLQVAPGRLTRFVGRQQELAMLVDRWEQAVEGSGQTVFVLGEAGLGKSRVALVFRERLGTQPHTWLECRSSPYAQGTAFHPVIELVEQGLAFGPGDDAETRLVKIREGIAEAGLPPDRVALVADLLDVPLTEEYGTPQLSPELQRERIFETLVEWLLALGGLQPILVLVEDLHWCDPSSIELFGRLMEQIPTSRVLMVLTARPEFEAPWEHLKNWTPISLGRLRHAPSLQLVRSLDRELTLPDTVVSEILERGDGVPLYLEELTRAAVEAEKVGAPAKIPATLQDSLMARLDRLTSAKEVAQVASVLGREFSYRILEAVADVPEPALRLALGQLEDADLIYQRGTPPEATYTFKHALIQEQACESMLRVRRREIHARIAGVLEGRFPELAKSQPEVVARHYEEGGMVAQAITAYERAGHRATRQHASMEAVAHLRRAIGLLADLPETRDRDAWELSLQLAIGPPLTALKGWGTEDVRRAFERAHELGLQLGDERALRSALVGLAAHYEVVGAIAKSLALHEEVLDLAQKTCETFPLLCAHAGLGQPLYFMGRFSEAVLHFERTIALYSATEHGKLGHVTGNDEGVVGTSFAAWCLWTLGYPERGLQRAQEAVELARNVEHPFALAHALAFLARTHLMRREWVPARDRAEEAITLSDELGFPLYLGLGRAFRARAAASIAPSAAAIEEIQTALGQLAASGTGVGGAYFLCMLAEAQGAVGKADDALGAVAVGLAMSKEESQPFADAELLQLKGELLQGQPDVEKAAGAETCLREALEVAQRQSAKSCELRSAKSLACLWYNQGRRAEARDLLQPVYDWFTEGFDTQDLKDAKTLLEELV